LSRLLSFVVCFFLVATPDTEVYFPAFPLCTCPACRYEPEPEPEPEQAAPTQGLTARALFDYQAGEPNELTFDPGDIITNIEQIDDVSCSLLPLFCARIVVVPLT